MGFYRLQRKFFGITVIIVGVLFTFMFEAIDIANNSVKVIKKVPTTHKVVAITVDDGPHYKTTPQLLAVLKAKQAKATFFVLGSNAETYPEIISQQVADGHEVASHAYSHKWLNKMTTEEAINELERTESVVMAVAPKPTLFRPPDGAYNDKVVDLARERGYTTVLWSVDTGDWRRPPVSQVVKNTLENVKPGSIILMHDGQYPLPTPDALAIIIDKLREQGYQFVTVSELLQYNEERSLKSFVWF